nr:polyprotein [Culex flavivirus]
MGKDDGKKRKGLGSSRWLLPSERAGLGRKEEKKKKEKRSVRSTPQLVSGGAQHRRGGGTGPRARGLLGRLGIGWGSILQEDIVQALMHLVLVLHSVFIAIDRRLRSLTRRVTALEAKRSAKNAVRITLILTGLMMVLGAVVIDMQVSTAKGTQIFEGKTNRTDHVHLFKLPTDGCWSGTLVMKKCPKVADLAKDLEGVDCGSSWTEFTLRYHRCVPKKRERRAANTNQKLDFLAEVELVTFKAIRENKTIAIIVLLCVAIAKRWPMWVVILLAIGTWTTVKGEFVEPLYTLKAEKMTMLQTIMRPDESYVISTPNGLLEFRTGAAEIYGGQWMRELLADCHANASYSTDVCPGGSQLNMGEINGKERVCSTQPYNRGWGTGCFKWGIGFVATCVELHCEEGYNVSSIARSSIVMNITAKFHSVDDVQQLISDVPVTFRFAKLGNAAVTCRLESERLLLDYYHVTGKYHEGLFVRSQIDEWPGAHATASGRAGLERIVVWGDARANEVLVKNILEPQLIWDNAIATQDGFRDVGFSCQIMLDKLVSGSFKDCPGIKSSVFVQSGFGYDGVVMTSLSKATNESCSVGLTCHGCYLLATKMVFGPGTSTAKAFVGCGNHTGTLVIGGTTIHVECVLNPISQGWRMAKHVVDKYRRFGTAGVGGVWYDFVGKFSLFSLLSSSTILVGLAALVLLDKRIVFLLLLCGYFIYTKADVGCGFDPERKVVSCGSGGFVWKSLSQWPTREHSVELDDQHLITALVSEQLKKTNKVCIICEDVLQCAAARGAVGDITHVDNEIVYVNTSLSFDRTFPRIPKKVHGVKIGDLTMQLALASVGGAVDPSQYGELSSGFLSRTKIAETGEHKVIRVITSASPYEKICEQAFALQYGFVRFTRRVFGSNVVVKPVAKPTDYCPTYLAGSFVKNDIGAYTDGMMWMKSKKVNGTWTLVDLELTQSHQCIWPQAYTFDLTAFNDSSLFMPAQYGAPMSKANHIPGYKTQTEFPWYKADIVLREGVVPGTQVEESPSCDNRGSAVKVDPAIAKKWCCKTCLSADKRVFHFKVDNDYFYPMEIRPAATQPEVTIDADGEDMDEMASMFGTMKAVVPPVEGSYPDFPAKPIRGGSFSPTGGRAFASADHSNQTSMGPTHMWNLDFVPPVWSAIKHLCRVVLDWIVVLARCCSEWFSTVGALLAGSSALVIALVLFGMGTTATCTIISWVRIERVLRRVASLEVTAAVGIDIPPRPRAFPNVRDVGVQSEVTVRACGLDGTAELCCDASCSCDGHGNRRCPGDLFHSRVQELGMLTELVEEWTSSFEALINSWNVLSGIVRALNVSRVLPDADDGISGVPGGTADRDSDQDGSSNTPGVGSSGWNRGAVGLRGRAHNTSVWIRRNLRSGWSGIHELDGQQ